ncbi:hypothetical protein C8J57DRAFT_1495451 [Mycena rebaudengoi]|nr:hypothetical protein C8J57DRAFT_1495451 [Mycena rebaudengoi]
MLHRYYLANICFMALITSAYASRLSLRGFDAVEIDGTNVPTATDLPAPKTTDDHSNISLAYQGYLENCGFFLDYAKQDAMYHHIMKYRTAYRQCEDEESVYKELLATFVPDTPSSTSVPDAGQSSGSTTNGDDKGKDNNGGAGSHVPKFITIILGFLTAQMLLI